MQVLPLSVTPSQVLLASLNAQACRIRVYTVTTGLFVDLYVNDVLIIGGVLALNGVLIVRDAYLGFLGDLCFFDLQGTSDPVYTGFGGRYILTYVDPGQRSTA